MEKKNLMSTREVAQFLNINEKMVYTLIAEKGLPATKVTGKWLFPRHLVEQWLENETINYPAMQARETQDAGLLVIAGSNDILLERAIGLHNRQSPDSVAVYGSLGSLGGIQALRRRRCQIAASHLFEEEAHDYNFGVAQAELGQVPVVVNFCRREQGILVAKGNPHAVETVGDLGQKGLRLVNRPLGTGTRQLLDREVNRAGLDPEKIEGYHHEAVGHMEVGLAVLAGDADAGLGIRAVAGLLGLDFLPLLWERFDLLVLKEMFFEKRVQAFLVTLQDPAFRSLGQGLAGYDLELCGKMVFPREEE